MKRGTFVLIDGDADDAQIEAAVRVLLGLPDDYDFDEGERAGPVDEAKGAEHEAGSDTP